VASIVRDGETIYEHEAECERVLQPDIANLITAMLQRVPASGTAASAFSGWGTRPVAGKTGTADLNKAVWFCGFTRQLSTAVWVGSNGNPYTLGSVFGGSVAAPIWRSYMSQIVGDMPVEGFPEPPPPPTATVPGVVGLDREEAIARLDAGGFNATIVEVDSLEPQGIVVAQTPAGGASADLGLSVRIEVSTGRAPETQVPGTIGLGDGVARARLVDAGFRVEIRYEQVDDKQKEGIVLRQDPPGGTPAAQGTLVTITVGR
jgi:membrane peptidoglycan carboxypeptidase